MCIRDRDILAGANTLQFFEHLAEIEGALKPDFITDLVDLHVGGGHRLLGGGNAGGGDKFHKAALAVLCKQLA